MGISLLEGTQADQSWHSTRKHFYLEAAIMQHNVWMDEKKI